MSDSLSVELVSVNVALPRDIGTRHRKSVISGIHKLPVASEHVVVTSTGLVGDGQGDLVAHGGPDKAVYAYPVEHLPPWTDEHRPTVPYGPGTFGENLSVSGLLETDVMIGDCWAWGEVVLQVCQPRYPCFKLGMKLNRPSAVREMVANLRTGWYLRVLQAGNAPVSGSITVVSLGQQRITVQDAHLARLPAANRELREKVIAEPALAIRLRESLERSF